MHNLQTVKRPQTTAKYSHIEFEVVNDKQIQLDRLLTARPEVCPDVVKPVRQVKTAPVAPVKVDVDKMEVVRQAIEEVKPVVKVLTEGLIHVIHVSGYMTGFIVVKVVKYSFLFIGAVVGGLIMSVVDAFDNHSNAKGFEEDEFEQQEVRTNINTINASGNSTVNIQINNK